MATEFKIEGLDEFKDAVAKGASDIAEEVRWAMTQAVNAVAISIRDMTPVKTGQLRRSITTDVQDSGFTGIIYSDLDMATYGYGIEFGNSPHDIYPVNGQALYWKGALHPVRHVHHPGNAAMPFFYNTAENNTDKIVDYFSKGLDKVLKIMVSK